MIQTVAVGVCGERRVARRLPVSHPHPLRTAIAESLGLSSIPGKSLAERFGTLMSVCRYAYVEFTEPGLVNQALVLNDSLFRGRNLKVVPKRTNLPGMSRGRGRGGGGGGGRGGYGGGRGSSYGGGRGGYGPPRGGGYRGGYRSRASGYRPY